MAAIRDLRAGEVVVVASPLCVGPRLDKPTPCCLGCHKAQVKLIPCPQCGLPVCSTKCAGSSHHIKECTLLQGKTVPLGAITPLRLLALKFSQPERFNDCLSMEANLTELRTRELWENFEREVIGPVVDLQLEGVDKGMVERLVGIILTNSFEVVANGCLLFGIFYEPALMNHHCVGNTRLLLDNGHQMTVVASQAIKKNQQIKFNYARALDPTLTRRTQLLENKYFLCKCERCEDQTELGSHMSSLLCACGGVTVPAQPLSLTSDWECVKCKEITEGGLVGELVRGLQREMEELDRNNMKQVRGLIAKYEGKLHKNHGLLTELKQFVISGLGRLPGFQMEDLREADHKQKVVLCNEVLAVLNKVDPGLSLGRGLMMFELHSSLVVVANLEFERRQAPHQLLTRLLEADRYLREAAVILKLEPRNSPYGHLASTMQENIRELGQYIEQVKNM